MNIVIRETSFADMNSFLIPDIQPIIETKGIGGAFESVLEEEIEKLNDSLAGKRRSSDLMGGDRPLLGQKIFGFRS